MTPTELRARLKALGWTQRHLALTLGVTARTVGRWATGVLPVPVYCERYLEPAFHVKQKAPPDPYGVLPHRDVLALPDGTYEHRPCQQALGAGDVLEANWCHHCAAVINKAAQRRGRAEWR